MASLEKLAYRIQKQTVTGADYIAWAHRRLEEKFKSEALFKLSVLKDDANLFEVESYFKQALRELQLELHELTSYEVMKVLTLEIVETTDEEEMKRLARELFHLACEAGYPENMSAWLEISDMQDRLQYDAVKPPYTEQDVLKKIQQAAKLATRKYTCPCCGYKTLDEEPPGTYEICAICYWEDDPVQFEDPDYEGGANVLSLKTAQQNVLNFGACDETSLRYVRKPTANDEKDVQWKPFV